MGFSKKQIELIEKKAREKCENRAKEAADAMETFYKQEVSKFYDEYSPFYYVRHHERGKTERGLDLPMKKVIEEKSDGNLTVYTGGIVLSPYGMYKDYSGTREQVLYSFLAGYHGLPPFIRPYELNNGEIFHQGVHPITSSQYNSLGTHPLKETRYFFENVLVPKLRKGMRVDVLNR